MAHRALHTTHPKKARHRLPRRSPDPTPRPFWTHQDPMFNYAVNTQHPALFVEMRLGKTMVTIRAIKTYGPGRVLVVAPNSAIPSWLDELKKEGEADVCWVRGTRQQRLRQLASGHRWCVINPEAWRSVPELSAFDWLCVVLDESTFIKNPKAKVTRFFCDRFRLTPHRMILTGIPAPEKDWDVFTQFQFLDGQAFGVRNFWQFRTKYYSPPVAQYDHDWSPNVGTKEMVTRAINERAFVLRRRDAGVEAHRVYERRSLFLPDEVRDMYDKAERDFVLEQDGKRIDSTVWATTRFLWMRQLCSGFVGNRVVWDGKFKELEHLLTGELCNEQVVVWFQYIKELTTAVQRLRERGVSVLPLYGRVPPKERLGVLSRFQSGRVRVLCVQHQVAKMGTDLSASDTAVYFSSPLALLERRQTEDRILNLNKSTSLLFLDMCVERTVEDSMLQGLRAKGIRSGLLMNKRVWQAIKERHCEKN